MFRACKSPAWQVDDFSPCYRQQYLDYVLPLCACGLSLATVIARLAIRAQIRWLRKYRNHASESVLADDATRQHVPCSDFMQLAFRLFTNPRKGFNRNTILLCIETATVVSGLVVYVAKFIGSYDINIASHLLLWLYLAAIVSIRVIDRPVNEPQIILSRYHTAFLYGWLWLLAAVLFRSALIHPVSSDDRSLPIFNFACFSLLFIVALNTGSNYHPKPYTPGDPVPSRELGASIAALFTFSWVDPIVWKAYKHVYELDDIWDLPPKDGAEAVNTTYNRTTAPGGLAWQLLSFVWRDLILQLCWAIIQALNSFIPVMLFRAVLQYIESPTDVSKHLISLYVLLILASGILSAVASGQTQWLGKKMCIRLRSILMSRIYLKALKRPLTMPLVQTEGNVPPSDRKRLEETHTSSGAVINMMSTDSSKVSEVTSVLHTAFAEAPIKIAVSTALLFIILGWSAIATLLSILLSLPISLSISKQLGRYQKLISMATDARIHDTTEAMNNIRTIKYFVWEDRFLARIDKHRKDELVNLRKRFTIWALAASAWSGIPMIIIALSFLTYTLIEKKTLVASVAFTALSLFGMLRAPLDQIISLIAQLQEVKVSIGRIERFLDELDTDKYSQLSDGTADELDSHLLGFERATFAWGHHAGSFKLIDLDFVFAAGRCNLVVGPTGSGKSSLLLALLGEMIKIDGRVISPSKPSDGSAHKVKSTVGQGIAYCAQQPWLLNGTIKSNILFRAPYQADRYHQVLHACCLLPDLESMQARDETLVGEKGIILSGGQKQRIALARALYSEAETLLLDDVLCAVDSHTARELVQRALHPEGVLMQNRTCILVTHNLTLCLHLAEFVVVLKDGRIVTHGPAARIRENEFVDQAIWNSAAANGHSDASDDASGLFPSESGLTMQCSKSDINTETERPDSACATAKAKVQPPIETKAVGRVRMKVIYLYLRSMGGSTFWIIVVTIFALRQALQIGSNVWISRWATAYDTQKAPGTSSQGCPMAGVHDRYPDDGKYCATSKGVNAAHYTGVYALLALSYMLITSLRDGSVFFGSLAASRRLHRRLMSALMYAKFQFFDFTPIGQILNRVSRDVAQVDRDVALIAIAVVHCVFSIITVIALISTIIPQFLLAGILMTVLYSVVAAIYIAASRDLKRIESVQRSPLHQQLADALSANGLATIRAYGVQQLFILENYRKLDDFNRPYLYLWAVNRWLAFRSDIIGSSVAFLTSLFILVNLHYIDSGAAGLALMYAVTFTEHVLVFIRIYSINEQNMNAVERIQEYFAVPQEETASSPGRDAPPCWPSSGQIEFVDFSAKYSEALPFVLRNISLQINSGERVAVVGRTGSGKTSLALALLRVLEAQHGKILIDHVDVSSIGLHELRSKVVMVPQDPALFTGTIRCNLDPAGLYTDEELLNSLRRVHLLGGTVSLTALSTDALDSCGENGRTFEDLNSAVSESGSNFSQGQRQLLCIARALLRESKILIFDEATASIDHETDMKIQSTIREIRNCTIITVAHRLRTVMDYDSVIVLENGGVSEFGRPRELMFQKDSYFESLCRESGEWDKLVRLASGEIPMS